MKLTTRIPMTAVGAVKLKNELKALKMKTRPEIIQAIAEARSKGDLSENAEYESAKHQQSMIEGKINSIENKLANANIIDPRCLTYCDSIVFGATVHLFEIKSQKFFRYQLVGEEEADIHKDLINYDSPLGKLMIGKKLNEVVILDVPLGKFEYRIVKIEYI